MITLQQYAANLVSERVPDVRKPVDVNALAKDMANACGCNEEKAKQYVAQAVRQARYRIVKAEIDQITIAAVLTEKPMVIDDHTPAEQFDA